jgi:hypothetical protein
MNQSPWLDSQDAGTQSSSSVHRHASNGNIPFAGRSHFVDSVDTWEQGRHDDHCATANPKQNI